MHVPQQIHSAISKRASYKSWEILINKILNKPISNNMIKTTFAKDETVKNSINYSRGLFFIPLLSADDTCIFTWTVRSRSSQRENNSSRVDDNVSLFAISHGLRLVTLPWRVHASSASNATAAVVGANTKWITSTNKYFSIFFIHLQFDVTRIAHYSDLITIPFALVTLIVLFKYYRNSHVSTHQLLLNTKTKY